VSRSRFIVISVLLDALLVFGGFVAAFLVRFAGNLPAYNFNAFLLVAPVLVVVYLGVAWTYGLYDPERSETAWTVIRTVTIAVTLGIVFVAAFAFFLGRSAQAWARWTIPIGWAIVIFLLVSWRLLFLHFGRIRWPEQRTLLVGTGPVSIELAEELSARQQWGWRVAGLLDARTGPDEPLANEVAGFPVLGRATEVARVARETKANRVIVVSPVALRELVESLVLADEVRVRVDVVPELYEIFIGSVDALIGDIPLMQITSTSVPRYYRMLKRGMDVAGSLLLLVVLSPVLLLAAIAIVVSDGSPPTGRPSSSARSAWVKTSSRSASTSCARWFATPRSSPAPSSPRRRTRASPA
jgi:FlaA1/EpsC-like NDP-sugar epimerase